MSEVIVEQNGFKTYQELGLGLGFGLGLGLVIGIESGVGSE
jgi:hypothetical protein